MAEAALPRRSLVFWALLALLAAILCAVGIATHLSPSTTPAGTAALQRVILLQATLPRAAMAVLCGAALGLSGLLLQRVLRNPLAEPSTLGISAGAQLAMAAAAIYAPFLLEAGREGVALAGGLVAVALVLALNWRRDLEPVSVVLAGMMVSLTATAASAALILANGEYMFSLFIWGGGTLAQQGWEPTLSIALRLVLVAGASLLLLRPLTILGLDEANARSLGVALYATRFMVIGLAVWLAASVTAQVGIIGFIGLAAPALAHLSGARSPRQKLIAAPLLGAILLWLADGLVQLFAGSGGERIPTGAATAFLGGPLLLWLLPRLRMLEWPSLSARPHVTRRAARPAFLLGLLLILALVASAMALALGRGPEGWNLAHGALFHDLLAFRGPRVAIAAAAGAMLAAAGTIMQRLTGNPLASPEILGVGTGAGVGLAAVLYLSATPGNGAQLAGAAVGALTVLVIMLVIAARSGFGPERLLLAGIAMSALCSAILTAAIATGNQQAFRLLEWIGGSTNEASASEAWLACVAAALLIAPLFFTFRWLDILPLGQTVAHALGLPLAMSRLLLVIFCAGLTAVASLLVGPLSFIGLIAPHLARLIGLHRPLAGLAGAIAIGSGLMILSDWLSRMVAFPYQLPLGLFASLIGGTYLIWMLGRGESREAA
ncbi:Fe(3+)-hydroxamate ABC transporter permease FhuB [Phyllobacterium phragmitis]|uniref:Fe(3+)-hydroxamate ABC transporter permease FhuB n=1 Tax=Phyllobacterium phragmitis TaxID=2670329 RepID=A0A2S9ITE7_9HYPH|nr:Fe(3+)-hydroxamate ABC transporter permease FhuB [Phyllobacterium phragmitis]PRD43795.1 Fe(3+)-hydroxamate ABC transporter permease FhuB [Phyllobacterium phragmitis]